MYKGKPIIDSYNKISITHYFDINLQNQNTFENFTLLFYYDKIKPHKERLFYDH